MKKIFIAILLSGLYRVTGSAEPVLPAFPGSDTVVISFGNNSKILVLVDNPQELKKISEFDVNAMLRDLSQSVDSLDGDPSYVRLEDETGEKYLSDSVTMVRSPDEMELEAIRDSIREELRKEMADRDQEDSHYDHKRRRRYGTNAYFNVELGMNNYLDGNGSFPDESNALYAVKPWGSWYAAINNNYRTHLFGPLFIDWGAGISWYNFKFQNAATRIEKGDESVGFFEDQTLGNPVKSKLTATYLNVSFIPVLSFGNSGRKKDIFHMDYHDNGLRIGFGGYAGYRLNSYAKYVWKESGSKEKDRNRSGYFLNNFRYGARAVLGIRSVDLFVNYDLNELFTAGNGPGLNAFSFGIIL